MQQLTTLSNARLYLYQVGDNVTADDALLQLLINQTSGAILSALQRPGLFRTTYTELRDGVGNQRMTLRNFPVLSVSSVQVETQTIPVNTTLGGVGWTVDTWDGTTAGQLSVLQMNGYYFCRGRNNVQVVYDAGYAVEDESYTVTSSTSSGLSKYTAAQPLGSWAQDDGVFYSSGTALTAVSSSPSSGQYSVTNGVYQFNVADAGQVLSIDYSYIPTDLEQACIQWVAERYSYRSRVGITSQTMGGRETSAYDTSAIPAFVALLIDPYKKWLPV